MPFQSPSRELCKVCYRANPVGFDVPDTVWEAVVPEPLRSGVVCLSCFARIADEKLISWDRDIRFSPVSLATHVAAVVLVSAEADAVAG